MSDQLDGRVALITGAGRGIGQAVAMWLAEAGASVVVNDLGVNLDGSEPQGGPADDTVKLITDQGQTAVASYDSIATWEGAHKAVQVAIDNFGRLDIMVHVAGVLRDRMFFNMTEDEWDIVIATHLNGAFFTSRAAAPHMINQNWGRIIIFSSGAGLGRFGGANYGAAKEGDLGVVRALARELGPYGITVNNVRPGAATRMTESIPQTTRERSAERSGIERLEEPDGSGDAANNASKVVFLCTEDAENINGQDLNISGWTFSINEPRHAWRSVHKNERWSLDDLDNILPFAVTGDLKNPSEPQ